MRTTTAGVLVVIAAAAVGAGWYYGAAGTADQSNAGVPAATLAFPDLAPKLQQAERIEVVHHGQTLVIAQKDHRWGLADRDFYPVETDKLHELLTALTELRLTERRTADPAEFARLGVDDPKQASADGSLLRVLDAGGKPIAELIAGHRRVRTQGDLPDAIYVRRPGEDQAWLAEGRLSVETDPQAWIDREIANVDHSKIASAVTTNGGQTLEFGRDGDKEVLKAPADHPKLDDYKVADVFRALENLTLTDVKPVAQQPGDKVGTSHFATSDGMTVDATVYKAGPGIWAQFAAKGEGAGKDPADKLEARVNGWTYEVGSWKEKALVPTMDDLKAAEPAKTSSTIPTPASPSPAAASPASPASSPAPQPSGAPAAQKP